MKDTTQMDNVAQSEANRESLMAAGADERGPLGVHTLTVALVGPVEERRKEVVRALAGSHGCVMRELTSYPSLEEVPAILESGFDVVILELDSDVEHALDLVEAIGTDSSVTVMVYSTRLDAAMLMRCMHAGAREYLSLPISSVSMEEAMVRAMARRPEVRPANSAMGKLMVFIGAKGGAGVTTIAVNFAVAVAQESGKSAVLIDLSLPIGDAALGLGIHSEFSVVNALQNPNRMDSTFFLKLLSKHRSGLSILAAPDVYVPLQVTAEAVERLLTVARQSFDYVIVDAGSNLGLTSRTLFKDAATVYLITQVSIPELRNSQRLLREFFGTSRLKPEVVLNRYAQRSLDIDEEAIGKALKQEPRWKVPSDYPTAMRAQNTAKAMAMEDSPISRVVRQMARAACGVSENPKKKSGFNLFG